MHVGQWKKIIIRIFYMIQDVAWLGVGINSIGETNKIFPADITVMSHLIICVNVPFTLHLYYVSYPTIIIPLGSRLAVGSIHSLTNVLLLYYFSENYHYSTLVAIYILPRQSLSSCAGYVERHLNNSLILSQRWKESNKQSGICCTWNSLDTSHATAGKKSEDEACSRKPVRSTMK